MKKNLLKILALCAIASVSFSGCFGNRSNGSKSSSEQGSSESEPESSESETSSSESSSEPEPVAEVISLAEAFEYDTIDREFVKAGQLVKLQQLCVYARWGHTIIVGVPYVAGGSILSLQGIEVEMDAQPDWKGVTNGRYANVDVEGTLVNVNGRPVLQGGVVTINAEAKYDDDGNRDENDGAFSAAYWPTSVTIRDYWDQYLGRSMSGILMEGIFQFASAPAAITAETETDFKIVFPGENTNGEDPDNEYLINVHVPKGLNETSVAFYNSFFVGKQAGDFVDMMAMTRFDMSKKGMGYVLDDFWIRYADDVPEDVKPTILTSWADVDAAVSPKFKTPLPNLADCESQGVFSYTLTSYFSKSVEDAEIFDEDTLAGLQIDVKEAAAWAINLNCGEAKTPDVLASARDLLAAAGWELDEELSDEKAKDFYYILKVSTDVVAEINIWAQSGAKSVSMIFMAYRATDEEVATLAAALALVQSRMLALDAEFVSAIPALPAAAETGIQSVLVDWRDEETADGVFYYSLEPTFAENTFADNAAWLAYANGLEEFLLAAGFKDGFAVPAVLEEGMYNETSGEFVALHFNQDNDSNITGLAIVYALVDADYAYDVSPDHSWTVDEAVYYLYDAISAIFGAPSISGTEVTDLYVGGYYDTSLSTIVNYLGSYCMPSCATFAGSEQTANANDDTLVDYHYYFTLPTESADKVIVLEIFLEAIPSAGAHYVDVLVYEDTAA